MSRKFRVRATNEVALTGFTDIENSAWEKEKLKLVKAENQI